METQTFANPDVLEFYKSLPFNYQDSVENQVKAIRSRDSVSAYPVLPPLLGEGVSVLEVGCGTGWLSNAISFYYKSSVVGLDFNPVAIARAREVAQAMKLKTTFEVATFLFINPKLLLMWSFPWAYSTTPTIAKQQYSDVLTLCVLVVTS